MITHRPLRVAFVSASLDVGGAERQMVHLAQHLPHDRFIIEFVLLTHRGALASVAEAAEAGVHDLGWVPAHERGHALRWLWNLLRFGSALRRGHYDIVDAWLYHAYAISSVTRPIHRIPVLLSGRRSLSDFKEQHRPILRLLDAIAKRTVDGIVANSQAVRADVARREDIDPRRIRVIHNGVEIPPPISASERESIRAGWGFGPDTVVVGSVANYKPRKGLETLLRVAAALHPQVPQLRMVLVGEGFLRPVLERMIAELGLGGVVRLHGREPDARRLFGAFDIVAHASESEGLPNVLLEAAAAGRPIVATAAGGTAEVVVSGESGLIVPVGDEEGFARELLRLANDPALRARLGSAARERAATVFGMDRFVAETAALYEELATSKGVRR
jgi:glycosyltransferase involved in cell wall biosynthesis